MRVKNVDTIVQRNIEIFLDLVSRVKRRKPVAPQDKQFHAYIHRQTGQLFLDEIHQDSSFLAQREWKPVELLCVYDPKQGEVCFLIEDFAENKGSFHYDDLSPLAFQILRQTLTTVNHTADPAHPSIESSESGNILMKAWHPATRFQAESILWNLPPGTYLFRKDPYAEMLEEQLENALSKKVKCITLTFSEKGKKFSDVTLVHCEGSWLIYNDDPSLEGPRYAEVQELLSTMEESLKYPLYAEKRGL